MRERRFITLPSDTPPSFPGRCPACGDSSPAEIDVATARAFHPGHLVLCFFMGRKMRLEIPYCTQCLWTVQRHRRWRSLTCLAGVVAAIALAAYVRRWVPSAHQNLVYVGAAFVALTPAFLWRGFAQPPVEATIEPDGIRFEFRDADYAGEFAGQNGLRGAESPGRLD